jgi:phosphatidylinositol dimannoside acyltransferase
MASLFAFLCRFPLAAERQNTNLSEAVRWACQHTAEFDSRVWLQRRRLTMLLDHADLYVARFTARRWLARRVRVTGAWPDQTKPGIAFTFHWGAGMLAQCHLRQLGRTAHMLVNAPIAEQFVGRAVLFRYVRARLRTLSAVLGRPVIDVQSSLRPVLKAVDANELVLAVIDVPTQAGSQGIPVSLLGQQTHAPRALFRLAIERQLPVTVYLTGIDFADGSRTLTLHQLGCFDNADTLAQAVFAYLDDALSKESAAWHLWTEYHRFFPLPLPLGKT